MYLHQGADVDGIVDGSYFAGNERHCYRFHPFQLGNKQHCREQLLRKKLNGVADKLVSNRR